MPGHRGRARGQRNVLRHMKQQAQQYCQAALGGINEKNEDAGFMADFEVSVAGAHVAVAQVTDVLALQPLPEKVGGGTSPDNIPGQN